jgi:hypothetical protein
MDTTVRTTSSHASHGTRDAALSTAHLRNTDTMVRQVQPLRISKSTPTASPDKQVAMSRPLAEISSGSTRRNSPSYNQSTRVCVLVQCCSTSLDAVC